VPCGYIEQTRVGYWSDCRKEFSYPCRLLWCAGHIVYPCLQWCHVTVTYPCGIRWCRQWGIRYPCGLRLCRATIPFLCLRACRLNFTYPCGFRFCTRYISYPCRKHRLADQYCYDFDYIGEHCIVFWKAVYGCCDGVEYKVDQECAGWFEGYESNRKICSFDAPKPLGPCREGYSLPQGMQVPQATTPGTLLPSGVDGRRLEIRNRWGWTRKLGACSRCMRLSFVLTALAWSLVLAFFPWSTIFATACATTAIAFSSLSIGHVTAFMLRAGFGKTTSCSCGDLAQFTVQRVRRFDAPLA
jgi:hypothetical protein